MCTRIFACLLFAALPTRAFAQSDREKCLAVVEASIQMLDRFTVFTCEYDSTSTRVLQPSDIPLKKFTRELRTGKISWHRSGEKESLFVIEDAKTTQIQKNPKQKLTPLPGNKNLRLGEPVPFMSFKHMAADQYWLRLSEKSASISNRPLISPIEQPLFGCLKKETSECLDECVRLKQSLLLNRVQARFRMEIEGGKSIIKILATYPNNKETCEYWFDPSRGLLMIYKIHFKKDRDDNTFLYAVHDAKDFDNRWFPTHVASGHKQKQMTDWEIRDSIVTKLEVDQEPKRSSFEIQLPAGAWLSDENNGKNFLRTQQEEVVHIDQLPEVYERVLAAAQMPRRPDGSPLMDTRLTKKSYGWVYWSLAGAFTSFILMAVAWRISLRIRARGHTT